MEFYDIYKRVTSTLGTQAGGKFEHRRTGQHYYVKFSKTPAHARNEVLASRLYAHAGIDVVSADLIDAGARGLGTIAPWIDEAQQDLYTRLQSRDDEYVAKIRQGFIIDAWLANWDVAGLVFDNIVSVNNNPVRLDTGGCLLYRGMGAPKGSAFDHYAKEFDTLRDFGRAREAAHLFATITNAEILDSAGLLAVITNQDIRDFVYSVDLEYHLAQEIIVKLISRRATLLDRVDKLA